LLKTSDLAIVTNPADYRQALKWGVKQARLQLVPIGSNIEPGPRFTTALARSVFRGELGLNDNDFAIGYFGLANRSKGLDTLLQALAELREKTKDQSYKLVIIGGETGQTDGDNRAYALELAGLIREFGLEEAIIRTGHRSASETSQIFYALDAVALPFKDGASFRRGSLLAPLAHGLPVVTTQPDPALNAAQIPGNELLPQLLDSQNILLVSPEAPSELAASLLKLRQDPAGLRERLGRGALALSEAFSWQSIGQRSLDLYRKLFED
jgi:polysaccharide biosynthesis protein PslF